VIWLWIGLGIVGFLIVFSLGWRLASRVWSLPWPSVTAWMVDNPIPYRLTAHCCTASISRARKRQRSGAG
jgi:hypothetical protein